METRQPALQRDVGLIGPGDEADRSRAGAELAGGLLVGVDHGRVQGEAEVAVGVHAEELTVGPCQPKTRAEPGPG